MSWVSSVLGYIFFTIWFFFKGVYIWSFDKSTKVLINIVTFLIEMFPGLDLLPGTTFMVWRHVKISQKQDKDKFAEQKRKQVRVIQGRMRRARNTVRRAEADMYRRAA